MAGGFGTSKTPGPVIGRADDLACITAFVEAAGGEFTAAVAPGSGILGRYAPLVAKGLLRLKPATTRNLDRLPACPVPGDASPVDLLLAEREGNDHPVAAPGMTR